jgi:integrase
MATPRLLRFSCRPAAVADPATDAAAETVDGQLPAGAAGGADRYNAAMTPNMTPFTTTPFTTTTTTASTTAAMTSTDRVTDPGAGPASEPATERPAEPGAGDRHRGLTEADLARITSAVTAAHAPATQKIYRFAWGQWERWCTRRGINPLPAAPAAVCAYLTERVEAGIAVTSLSVTACAISHVHRTHGLANPMAHHRVRQVRAGLRRTHGVAPRRQARPLSVTELRQIITAIDRRTVFGARVAAIILLGYASALRTGELAALSVADLEPKPAGLFVHIHRSKTDQDATGEVVGVAHGTHPDTDPVTAISSWLRVRGTAPGPLFVRLRGGVVSDRPLAPHTLSRLLHARAEVAGLPAARITGHSLRAGHATAAYAAGVRLDRIAAQTRHKDLAVLLNRYIRPLDALETTTSRDLGL